MLINQNALSQLNSDVRQITACAYVYEGTSTKYTFKATDNLQSFTVERIGQGKFFGYGICQKINMKVRDVNRQFSVTTANQINLIWDVLVNGKNTSLFAYPRFKVSEVHRDENTNALSITAYDALYEATKHNVSELTLADSYTIKGFIASCAALLGLSGYSIRGVGEDETCFDTSYAAGANFEGTETIREALDAVAEVTQTVYFITNERKICFRRLSLDGDANFTIDKEKYFTLSSKTNKRLGTIVSATELGDNLSVSTTESGSTQYIRNNPFWDLREDRATLLDNALAAVGGFTLNQFECDWHGNYLLEIGDKIALVTKDNSQAISYVLDDTIEYNGGILEKTKWSYEDNENETDINSAPTNLGDAIRQTYAKVDKANKEIEIVASQAEENSNSIAAIKVNVNSINATVQQQQQNLDDSIDSLNNDVAALNETVASARLESQQAILEFKQEIEQDGIDKVTTSTGFTFNEEGMTVEKSGKEMKTTITEDGMTVYRSGEGVLQANNEGVKAKNLHANTYLIIGNNSRFEDYKYDRTGCFWIGS
nr:MAG TPA: hypothetical protein [Caudoviricetes sp.]